MDRLSEFSDSERQTNMARVPNRDQDLQTRGERGNNNILNDLHVPNLLFHVAVTIGVVVITMSIMMRFSDANANATTLSTELLALTEKYATLEKKYVTLEAKYVTRDTKYVTLEEMDVPLEKTCVTLEEKYDTLEKNLTLFQRNIITNVTLLNITISTIAIDIIKLEAKNQLLNVSVVALNGTLMNTINETVKLKGKVFSKFNETEQRMENINDTLAKHDANLTESNDLLNLLITNTTFVDERLSSTWNLVHLLKTHTFNKDALIFAIVVLFVLQFLSLVYIINSRQSSDGDGHLQQAHMNSKEVMAKIPSKPSLDKAVCVISFDQSRAAFNMTLVSDTIRGVEARFHLIQRHAHITSVPRCKLFVMCVTCSERHVIIEEQGIGLGDLKRTTYNAIEKLGGDLVIIYTHDPGSRRLVDTDLFNKQIYCVTSQPELRMLYDKKQFLSL